MMKVIKHTNKLKFLSYILVMILCFNLIPMSVYAEETEVKEQESLIDVNLIDWNEIGKLLDDETIKNMAYITNKEGIYDWYKIISLTGENIDMVNTFLPEDMKIEALDGEKVELTMQDGELIKSFIEESVNPWNLYGDEVSDFLTDKYEKYVFKNSNYGKKFSIVDDAIDYVELGLKFTELLSDINTNEVDGAVQLYVSGLNFATGMVEALGLDDSVLVKGSIGICDAATGYAESVMSSKEYEAFKAQYDTKLGFTAGFLASSAQGLWDLYSGIDEEIYKLMHDEELWDMIFPNRNKTIFDMFVSSSRAPAPGSISGLAPAPTIIGGQNGPHVIVEWGTDINDLNVTFFSN